jgi:hypothetical protein
LKRIMGRIVVADPHPGYSDLDRMDGLDGAGPKVDPPSSSHTQTRPEDCDVDR